MYTEEDIKFAAYITNYNTLDIGECRIDVDRYMQGIFMSGNYNVEKIKRELKIIYITWYSVGNHSSTDFLKMIRNYTDGDLDDNDLYFLYKLFNLNYEDKKDKHYLRNLNDLKSKLNENDYKRITEIKDS